MRNKFFLTYIILLIAQLMISNYFNLGAYVMLSILPIMVLCIPAGVGTIAAMFIAFATGLATDFLSEGVVGLNALALVPVAFIRKTVLGFVFGEEIIVRNENFSIRKNGLGKVAVAVLIAQSLFLLIYIIADGVLTRSFLFFIGRFLASIAAGVLISVAIVDIIDDNDRR